MPNRALPSRALRARTGSVPPDGGGCPTTHLPSRSGPCTAARPQLPIRSLAGSPEFAGGRRPATGFTLVELVLVIIVLGILASVAIPRMFDIIGDSRRAGVLGALGGVRTAISLYYHRQSLPPPQGSNRPYYPTLTLMLSSANGVGIVLGSRMPFNPFNLSPVDAIRNQVVPRDANISDGTHPVPVGTTGAWAYDPVKGSLPGAFPQGEAYVEPPDGFDVGQFWADTNTPNFEEFRY